MAAEDTSGADHARLRAAWPDTSLIDLRQLAKLLWFRRRTIAFAAGLTIVASVLYLLATPATYVAQAVLLIDPQQPNITQSPNVVDGFGQDAAMIESQVEVIQSRQLLMPVFDALGLASDPEFARTGLVSQVLVAIMGIAPAPSREETYERFFRSLAVERRGLTYILSVAFKSQDREKAAQIANFIAESYVANQVSLKTGTAAEVTTLLEDRVVELRAAVEQAEEAIEAFTASVGYVAFANNPALFETELIEVSRQLVAAKSAADTARRRYLQLAAGEESPTASLHALFSLVDTPVATDLRRQFNEKAAELSRASGTLGGRHPTILSLELELGKLEAQMSAEVDRVRQVRQAELEIAEQEAAALSARVDALKADTATMRQAEVQLRALEREAEARRTVLEEFMQRAQETSKQGALQRPDAEIISAAVPPINASWPNALLVLALGGLAGLTVGATAAFLRGAEGVVGVPAQHRPQRVRAGGFDGARHRKAPERRLTKDRGHERA